MVFQRSIRRWADAPPRHEPWKDCSVFPKYSSTAFPKSAALHILQRLLSGDKPNATIKRVSRSLPQVSATVGNSIATGRPSAHFAASPTATRSIPYILPPVTSESNDSYAANISHGISPRFPLNGDFGSRACTSVACVVVCNERREGAPHNE